MSRSRVQVLQLAACVAFFVVTNAPDAQEDSGTLDEIVVTATRMQSSIGDVARSISIIDKERIQNATQQLGLGEALAGVPGLYIQNRYNFSQDLSISLRGFGARASFGIRGIRVYVDGIPETLPDGQAQVDSIDLGSAESIEVLRGPASSLYGNASGGVIAIETELGADEPYLEAGLAAGELGFEQYGLKTGGSWRKLDYLFNVSHQEIDGYREHSFAEGSLLNGKVGVRLNDDDHLTIAINHTDQPEAQDPGAIDAALAAVNPRAARDLNLLFDSGESLSQQRLGVVYERQRPTGSLLLRNYYVWRDFENRLPFVDGGAVDFDRFFYGAGIQYTFGEPLPEAAGITAGIDFDRQIDDRRRYDNNQGKPGDLVFDQRERVDSLGAYVLGEYDLGARWNLSASLRYDQVTFDVGDRFLADGDDSGEIEFDQVSPSLGASFHFGEHVVFGSFSSSFETPTTTELANPDGSGGFNAALEPQRADNYEIGIKGEPAGFYYELALFHIELTGELVPFEIAGFPGRTFFSNAGESTRNGLETAVSWRHDSGFGAEASWTWSDFEFDTFTDESGTPFGGKQLPGLPEHFGYAGLTYSTEGGFYARFEARYSGELYADNANTVEVGRYTVANLRASYEIEHGHWSVQPYAGVNNLFDERYNSHIRTNAFGGRYYEPAPERNAYAGVDVRYRFDGL
ncbi:MAG TPA: TonB-dependent receptor [Woeseiaceae bacterium]|nr:TonB-dependent receptor [Woeseiaceae bacterium]